MSMKWFIIKWGCLLATLFSTVHASASEPVKTRGEEKEQQYIGFWNGLIPKYVKVQYAGSMGLVSVGPGWEYGKRKNWETDLFLGFLPAYQDARAKMTFTLKQNYIPWNFRIKESRWSVEPLACGMYVNSMLDKRFWGTEPEKYPNNYYKFSTKIRFHIYAGQRISFDFDKRQALRKSITAFYEISSCDLYIISAATNKYLSPKDYLSLSFGIKVQLL
ncbi:MAG: hypothetical protein RR339_06775 [Bacteroidales bacterium]